MKTYLIRASLFALVAVSFDQLTKYWAHTSSTSSINSGISFGLFSGTVTTVFLFFVLLGITLYILIHRTEFPPALAGLFLGASASNLLDRLFFGGVRDFLPVPILNVQNNLADWIIVLALGVYLCMQLEVSKQKQTNV